MSEHWFPRSLKIRPVRGDRVHAWHFDLLVFTLLPQDIEQDRGRRSSIYIPEQVDYVVEISGPSTFTKSPYFFSKRLCIRIGQHLDSILRSVAVRVVDRQSLRSKHDFFIGTEIKFDSWELPFRLRTDWTAVGDLSLAGCVATGIYI